MKYDKEEKDILEAFESGETKLSKPSRMEIESIKATADNTFKKTNALLFAFMITILQVFRKKQWKWGSHIKRLSPASFIAISKVI